MTVQLLLKGHRQAVINVISTFYRDLPTVTRQSGWGGAGGAAERREEGGTQACMCVGVCASITLYDITGWTHCMIHWTHLSRAVFHSSNSVGWSVRPGNSHGEE